MYLVELHDACINADCHIELSRLVKEHRKNENSYCFYSPIDGKHGQIYTTALHLESLKSIVDVKGMKSPKDSGVSQFGKGVIQDYVPMQADTRINADLETFLLTAPSVNSNTGTDTDKGHYELLSIKFVTVPMAQNQLDTLVSDITAMLKSLEVSEMHKMDQNHVEYRSSGLAKVDRSKNRNGQLSMLNLEASGLLPNLSKSAVIHDIPHWLSTAYTADKMNPSDAALNQIVEYLVSHNSDIMWIERDYELTLSNRWSRGLCQSGDYTNTPIYGNSSYEYPTEYVQLTGDGQTIGVADSGLDMSSCYFYDPYYNMSSFVTETAISDHRKIAYYSEGYNGDDHDNPKSATSSTYHGTHVSGTAVGLAYNSTNYGDYQKYNGHAYNAKIAFYDMENDDYYSLWAPSNIDTDMFLPLYSTGGARIITNSWGDTSSNAAYTSHSRDVDQFMYDYPDSLVIFAAGNTGSAGAESVLAPGTNKNGVCVGASSNDYQSWEYNMYPDTPPSYFDLNSLASFSSRGPTADGRLKPDVVASGYYTSSAEGSTTAPVNVTADTVHCDTSQASGTSMSAPAVAGNAALIREYFVKGYYPSGSANSGDAITPSGALLKAMLVQTATALSYIVDDTTPTEATELSGSVNYDAGFGRVQIDKVLNFGASSSNPMTLFVVGAATNAGSNYAEFSSSSDADYTHDFVTGSSTTELRVTMAYTDSPGTVGASTILVNDLDVTLTNTDTNEVYYPELKAAQGTINNIERIYLVSSDVTGGSFSNVNWRVTVSPTTISVASQPFALVVSTDQIVQLPYSESDPSLSGYTYESSGGTLTDFTGDISTSIAIAMVVLTMFVFSIKRYNQPDSMVHGKYWTFVGVYYKKVSTCLYKVFCCCLAKRDEKLRKLREYDEEDDLELQAAIDATMQ